MAEKVLIISQYFPPDFAGSGHQIAELAEDLSAAGVSVAVLAGKSAYFKSYSDGLLAQAEKKRPFLVKKIKYPSLDKNKKLGRIFNSVSFPIAVLCRLLFLIKYDYFLIISNPPTSVIVGALLDLLFGKKYICLVHDIYPDIAEALGVLSSDSLVARLMRRLNFSAWRGADKIVVLSQSMRDYIISRYQLSQSKVRLIYNWEDTNQIRPLLKDNDLSRKVGYNKKFVVLGTGNIGLFQEWDLILEAASKLVERKELLFVFGGEGGSKERLQSLAESRKLTNVQFRSYVPDENYAELLASADCLILGLKPDMEKYSFPGRIYSYMAASRPIVTVSKRGGELSRLIEENEVGFSCQNAEELLEALIKLMSDERLRQRLGQNARKLVENKFSRKIASGQFVALVKEIGYGQSN